MSEQACQEVQQKLLEYARGKLARSEAAVVEAHVAGCAACAAALAEERALDELLQTRLPAIKAPDRLQRALAVQLRGALAPAADGGDPARELGPVAFASAADSSNHSRGALAPAAQSGAATAGAARFAEARLRDASVTRRSWLVGGLGALSLAAAGVIGLLGRGPDAASHLPREALNDHLRVLYAQNPVEIPNGGLHQVKPWFTGRVDFAPDISFVGDDDFPMLGGAVGYFVDRKAASFVFKRRLHTISLFVFRSDGLEWPRGESQQLGGQLVQTLTLDGFHQMYWEAKGLGHVLVSDVSSPELLQLAHKLLQ